MMTPDYKALSRGYSRDLSSAAITTRLDKVAELYELWKFLRTGKCVVRERRDGHVNSHDDDRFR